MTDPAPKPPTAGQELAQRWRENYCSCVVGHRCQMCNFFDDCPDDIDALLRDRAAQAVDEEAIRRDEMERCCGMLIDIFGPDSTAEAYIRGRDRKGGG